MQKIRFMYNNLWDAATTTLTSSTEATGFPDTNTQNHWYARRWRSTGVASEWLKVDLATATQIKCCIVYGHNFTSSAVVKIEGATTDGGLGSAYIGTLEAGNACIVKWLDQTYRWWRITVIDPTNTDGYISIGRVYLGSYFSPGHDLSAYSYEYRDPSDVLYSTGGQFTANELSKYKIVNYQFNFVTQADKDTFVTMFDTVGLSKPYFIAEDPDAWATRTWYARNISPYAFDFLFYDSVNVGYCHDLVFSVETCR